MATSNETIEYVLETLNSNSITVRKMFGEYALYYEKRVVGFVCDDVIFLKITPKTTLFLGSDFKRGPAYKGSSDYFIIDEEIIEKKGELLQLLELCSLDVTERIIKN